MNRKRILTGICLTALLLSGCGNTAKTEYDSSKKQEKTVSAVLFGNSSGISGRWTGKGAEKLWEDTGIHLDFYSGGSRRSRRLWQYLAAGTMPDIIGFDSEQMKLLRDTGQLLNLDEYKEKLPAIYGNDAWEKALNYCRESFGGEEKGLYFLPSGVGEHGEEEFEWLPMLQWKPYEQAGCPKITTLEDYLDAAEAMLRYKSTTPLGERVYGFSIFSEWDVLMAGEAGALSYFYGTDTGFLSPLMEMDARNGEIRAVTDEDSFYKRALHFYFEANRRGLLDPDSETQTFEGMKRKFDQGRVLFSTYSWLVQDYNDEEMKRGFPENQFVPLPAQDMKIYQEPDNPIGNGWYYGISAGSSDPEASVELLNWIYERENITELYRNPGAMSPFQELGLTGVSAGVKNRVIRLRTLSEEESSGYVQEESIGEYLRERDMTVEGSNAVNLVQELPLGLRELSSTIGECVRELSWEMIYARDEESFQTLWKKMVKEARLLGISRVKKYYQGAWQSALEKELEYE